MYTKEQKARALKEFERLGSVQAVVTLLGYPSRHTLYEWYRKKIADITDYHGSLDKEYIIKQKYINKPNHPRNPDTSLKLDVIKRCFSLGEGVEYVSRDIGYSRASIYSWYRKNKKFIRHAPESRNYTYLCGDNNSTRRSDATRFSLPYIMRQYELSGCQYRNKTDMQ